MRRLWTEERVTFDGEYYRTERATVYDRPDEPVPVYVAAWARSPRSSPCRVGDGFICERQAARALRGVAGRRRRRRRGGGSRRGRNRAHDRGQGLCTTTMRSTRATPAAGGRRSSPRGEDGVEDPVEMESSPTPRRIVRTAASSSPTTRSRSRPKSPHTPSSARTSSSMRRARTSAASSTSSCADVVPRL